ncbi:MAG: DUF4352 domain-containing protein [Clostridiales Family XIII bacterium]|jgi:hypothetical protein|nr:DUF4352 domain-containing protein [Clostridiales Family XIII bacterium]
MAKSRFTGATLARTALVAALAALLAVGGAGCGAREEAGATVSGGGAEASLFDKVGKYFDAKGRSYGHISKAKVGETLNNSFFAWTLEGMSASEALLDGDEEILPSDEGNKFVTAAVRTENISDSPIPVGNYDFLMLWEDVEGAVHEENAYETFMEGMYPDEVTEEPGESQAGFLVFEVPREVSSGMIVYYEYYGDEFEGDAYMFDFTLSDELSDESGDL